MLMMHLYNELLFRLIIKPLITIAIVVIDYGRKIFI